VVGLRPLPLATPQPSRGRMFAERDGLWALVHAGRRKRRRAWKMQPAGVMISWATAVRTFWFLDASSHVSPAPALAVLPHAHQPLHPPPAARLTPLRDPFFLSPRLPVWIVGGYEAALQLFSISSCVPCRHAMSRRIPPRTPKLCALRRTRRPTLLRLSTLVSM